MSCIDIRLIIYQITFKVYQLIVKRIEYIYVFIISKLESLAQTVLAFYHQPSMGKKFINRLRADKANFSPRADDSKNGGEHYS